VLALESRNYRNGGLHLHAHYLHECWALSSVVNNQQTSEEGATADIKRFLQPFCSHDMDYTLASGESVYYEAKYRRGIYLLCNISNRLQYTHYTPSIRRDLGRKACTCYTAYTALHCRMIHPHRYHNYCSTK
jgi:hypothetical protein